MVPNRHKVLHGIESDLNEIHFINMVSLYYFVERMQMVLTTLGIRCPRDVTNFKIKHHDLRRSLRSIQSAAFSTSRAFSFPIVKRQKTTISEGLDNSSYRPVVWNLCEISSRLLEYLRLKEFWRIYVCDWS
jgi:hypothetical protein